MDVLVPGIGEIIGGSAREERLDVLEARIRELGLPMDQGDHSRGDRLLDFVHPVFRQLFPNQRGGPHLRPADLRIPVNVSADSDDFVDT